MSSKNDEPEGEAGRQTMGLTLQGPGNEHTGSETHFPGMPRSVSSHSMVTCESGSLVNTALAKN